MIANIREYNLRTSAQPAQPTCARVRNSITLECDQSAHKQRRRHACFSGNYADLHAHSAARQSCTVAGGGARPEGEHNARQP